MDIKLKMIYGHSKNEILRYKANKTSNTGFARLNCNIIKEKWSK